MSKKKQILAITMSVLLSVGLVSVAVNAATSVGNDVSVGGDLAVTSTSTLTLGLVANANVTIGSEAADDLIVMSSTTLDAVTFVNAVATFNAVPVFAQGATFSASATFSNEVNIGGGQPITQFLTATSSVDFDSVSTNDACATSVADITVTGAIVGDVVTVGMPDTIANTTTTLVWSAWVKEADLVEVRLCYTGTSDDAIDPAAAVTTFNVWRTTD